MTSDSRYSGCAGGGSTPPEVDRRSGDAQNVMDTESSEDGGDREEERFIDR
jgi:hypothetical protein